MKNKIIKSQDGKFELKFDEVTHVCIAPNIYPFLQYFLLMEDDIAFHHTYYFFSDTIPMSVIKQLPCWRIKFVNRSIKDKVLKRINKIKLRFFKYQIYPFLKNAEIFAYDIPYLSLCIGKRPYSLLADAPNWVTLLCQEHSHEYIRNKKHANSLLGKMEGLFFGDLYIHFHGQNHQCKAIYLTEDNTAPVLEGKEVYINSMTSLWNQASDAKKQFIMKLFDITNEDIAILSSRQNIFFTQPIIEVFKLSEEEYLSVLVKIFQNYPSDSLIIKTHPLDKFDYKKHFPEIRLFTKPISSQLLQILGLSPAKVITIASTAIEAFPETVECDFYGFRILPKIEKSVDDNYKPFRKVNFR
ncbi:MAG: hypothetical protein IKH61_02335 [Bacteroidales bacterium]|nr:hypothetical protein [Bacteroidales bacterium]